MSRVIISWFEPVLFKAMPKLQFSPMQYLPEIRRCYFHLLTNIFCFFFAKIFQLNTSWPCGREFPEALGEDCVERGIIQNILLWHQPVFWSIFFLPIVMRIKPICRFIRSIHRGWWALSSFSIMVNNLVFQNGEKPGLWRTSIFEACQTLKCRKKCLLNEILGDCFIGSLIICPGIQRISMVFNPIGYAFLLLNNKIWFHWLFTTLKLNNFNRHWFQGSYDMHAESCRGSPSTHSNWSTTPQAFRERRAAYFDAANNLTRLQRISSTPIRRAILNCIRQSQIIFHLEEICQLVHLH